MKPKSPVVVLSPARQQACIAVAEVIDALLVAPAPTVGPVR